MTFRAGDTVYHRPTGETWFLIADEANGHVYPGGWPSTRADASDCELRRAATGAERLAMLRHVVCSGHAQAHRAATQLETTKADWDRNVSQVRTAFQQLRDSMGTHSFTVHIKADPERDRFRRVVDRLVRHLSRGNAITCAGIALLFAVAVVFFVLSAARWPWALIPAAVALTAASGYLGLAWAWNEEANP